MSDHKFLTPKDMQHIHDHLIHLEPMIRLMEKQQEPVITEKLNDWLVLFVAATALHNDLIYLRISAGRLGITGAQLQEMVNTIAQGKSEKDLQQHKEFATDAIAKARK